MTLHGIELRYVLTEHLARNGPSTVNEMVDALSRQGFAFRGRPSKAISDAMRWEMGRDRVRRIGRGRYGPRGIPRSTKYRIHRRVEALREAAELSLRGGHKEWQPNPKTTRVDVINRRYAELSLRGGHNVDSPSRRDL